MQRAGMSPLKKISVADFINDGWKASENPHNFWQYNAVNSNCQQFVGSLLLGSGLLSADLKSFIYQDAAKVLENAPLTQRLGQGITDIAGRLDTLLHGAGRMVLQPKSDEVA